MNILDMREAHPSMFCPGQVWYENQSFAFKNLTPLIGLPSHLIRCPQVPPSDCVDLLTDAVLLVGLYLQFPHDAIWRGYLWSADKDDDGQWVYVGGTANGRGLEIHRHLVIDHRWSFPTWS